MKYMLIAYESTDDFAARAGSTGKDRQGQYWTDWQAFGQALSRAGVCLSMHGLQSAETASTLRLHTGQRQVVDQPYSTAADQIGGYFILEVPHKEAALEWAARCPAAVRGAVEIRPLLERG